jgi:hypothetical protein
MADFSVGRKLLFGSAFRFNFTGLEGLNASFFTASGELARIIGPSPERDQTLGIHK